MMKRYIDVFAVDGLQREVTRRAHGAGLRIVFDPAVEIPHINCASGTIFMPEFPAPITDRNYRLIRMLMIHEMGHYHNKEAMKLRVENPIDIKSNLGGMWNLLQDEFDDKTTASKHLGDAKALGEGYTILTSDQLANIKVQMEAAKKAGAKMKPDGIKRLAAFLMAHECRTEWDDFNSALLVQLRRTMPPEVVELADILIKEGWDKRISELETAKQILTLACELTKRLWPEEDPEEQLRQAQEKTKKRGEKKGGEGDDDSEDGDSGEEQEGEANKEDKEKDNPFEIRWQDLIRSSHSTSPNEDAPPGGHTSRIKWDGKPRGMVWKPCTTDQIKEIKLP